KTEQNIVEQTGQTVFACNLVFPLNVHARLIIVCPPYAEKEHGFHVWLERVLRLADTLTARTLFYCTPNTIAPIGAYISRHKFNATAEHYELNDWEDFLIITREAETHDLIMTVLSRKGGISYSNNQANIPQKLAKHFKDNSFILIHPDVSETETFRNFSS